MDILGAWRFLEDQRLCTVHMKLLPSEMLVSVFWDFGIKEKKCDLTDTVTAGLNCCSAYTVSCSVSESDCPCPHDSFFASLNISMLSKPTRLGTLMPLSLLGSQTDIMAGFLYRNVA